MRSIEIIVSMFLFVYVASCSDGSRSSIDQLPNHVARDPASANVAVSPFWEVICKKNRFAKLFDCNKSNCFQVELFQDPFKDLVVLTIDLDDSSTDIIHYTKIAFRRLGRDSNLLKKQYNIEIAVANPVTKDTIFGYLISENTKRIAKNYSINSFFNNLIWEMPVNDGCSNVLDPETWTVKGRLDGREIILSRRCFSDSTYYWNIQSILDVFNIVDYKYTK